MGPIANGVRKPPRGTPSHVGPYDGLGDTWAWLMGEWLPRSGNRVGDGMSYEVHRSTPTNAKPPELLTDIYVPLR